MKNIWIPALLALLVSAMPVKAALIYISPAEQQVAVDDTVSVDVYVSGLAGEIVSAWNLNMLFDDTILQAIDVFFDLANFTDDPMLDAIYDVDITGGEVSTFLTSVLTDADLALKQTEPVRLFSVSFLALTDGVSLLNFGTDPDFELNVVGRNGLSLQLDPRGACIGVGLGQCAVVEVPVPATLWLFALAVVFPLSRRYRDAAISRRSQQ